MDQQNEPDQVSQAANPQVPEPPTERTLQPSIEGSIEPDTQTQQSSDGVAHQETVASDEEQVPAKKRKKSLLVIVFVALFAITVCGVFLATHILRSELQLQSHQGDGFSIDYPAGYEVKTDDTGVTFKEIVGEDEGPETASQVYVVYAKIGSLEPQQKQLIAANFEKVGETFVSSISSAGRNDTKNNDEQKTTLLGRDAKQLTGDVFDGEKQAGSYKLVVRLTDTDLVLLGVASHVSDADVALAADRIINSFQITR